MAKIRVTQKNEFFTYFELDGMEGKFRILKQVWNANGISMMVQGPSWDGNGINGFGKRHLLATEGGNFDGRPQDKAKSILDKRQGGTGSSNRGAKLTRLVNHAAGAVPPNMRDQNVRDAYQAKKTTIRTGLQRGYAPNAYGPNTDICTFVILDGLTQQQAADYFAKAIVAKSMTEGQDAHVTVEFDDARVIDAQTNGDIDYYYAITVQVKLHNGIYHIYHCVGAEAGHLAVAFATLFG